MSTEGQQEAGAGGAVSELDEFSALLKQNFKPRTESAASEVEKAVTTLVKNALADGSVIKEDVVDTVEEMIAKIDEKLTAQVNEIIHHDEFQKVESAWRGFSFEGRQTHYQMATHTRRRRQSVHRLGASVHASRPWQLSSQGR